MSQINKMSDAKLVDRAIMLDNEKKTLDTELTGLKAEIQKRGLLTMMDHNIKYCKMYGDAVGTAIVSESQEIDILNMDRLREIVGDGLVKEKVTESTFTKYKLDKNFDKMIKAVCTGDYTFEYSLEEFLDQMSVPVDAHQKELLLKKLKGDYKADKKTLLSVLGYLTKGTSEAAAEAAAPDLDVELYYISKIKNAELILAFLPEEGIDSTMEAIRRCVIVDSKLKIELAYKDEE
ncbi:MAG: hypothetical protein KHY39_10485 [Clostridiaceae bacterium]|nr:hypothetical protein [Clostridiaceae bacterium]